MTNLEVGTVHGGRSRPSVAVSIQTCTWPVIRWEYSADAGKLDSLQRNPIAIPSVRNVTHCDGVSKSLLLWVFNVV